VTKRVLSAIAQVVPDDGQTHLTRIDIRPGWGNILNVRLHTPMARSAAGQEFGARSEKPSIMLSVMNDIPSKSSGTPSLGRQVVRAGTFGPREFSVEAGTMRDRKLWGEGAIRE
jgi:hypothetical protein